MSIITQIAHARQRMVLYAKKHGTTKASLRYKTSRKTVTKWSNRYDGTLESLKDQSRRPHTSPRSHSPKEIKMVKRWLKKVRWEDLLYTYQKLKEIGYTRSYGGFKRLARKLYAEKPKKQKTKKKAKPYTRACYPGQKIQIDVKYVPSKCVIGGKKYYQFTAKDECSRWTFRQLYDDKSSYSAKLFLDELIEVAPFPIRMVQTDNGTEFTNALLVVKSKHKTLFEEALSDMDILYKRIRIATPRHNGKVERQHRTDNIRFYSTLKFLNLAEGRAKMAKYQALSNNIIMTCLNMQSPNQVLDKYLAIM
jgi:transposase-like protein